MVQKANGKSDKTFGNFQCFEDENVSSEPRKIGKAVVNSLKFSFGDSRGLYP